MDILKVKQNGNWVSVPAIIGPRGTGIDDIVKTATEGLQDTYTIIYSDNSTTTFAVSNGSGISNIQKTGSEGIVDTYTITYTNGTTSTYTVTNGAIPQFTIGTVAEGAQAAATITGTAAEPILNLVLPNANVPTRVSELENDANYAVDSNYVHTDNNYTTAEKEKLASVAAGAEVNVNADWDAASGDAQILNKPTNVSAFTNDAGYLTTETDPTVPAWAKAAQKPSYTAAEVGAPTIAEMNTAIGEAIGQVNSFDMAVVQELPTQDISTHTIYLIPKTGETNDVYDEYIYINSAWEMVGNTQIDLSDYALKSELISMEQVMTATTNNSIGYIKGSYVYLPPTLNYDDQESFSCDEFFIYLDKSKGIVSAARYGQNQNQTAQIEGIDFSRETSAPGLYIAKIVNRSMTYKRVIADVPVQDVQVNGTSILNNGTANVDMSAYATKVDTVLDTTLSLGRLDNSEAGENSIALGYDVIASGDYSFATGSETIASSDNAHAEGENTQATDSAAHAEGTYTEANGYASHAEGDHSVADGWFAHAEGSETTASGRSTHVFGERNFDCNSSATDSSRGNMVEIVGNGQGNTYGNARALTWTGDEYLAGNLYVNANSSSTGGTRVATVAEIPEVPVQDVQVAGTSVVGNGIANIPIASASSPGAFYTTDTGFYLGTANNIGLNRPTDNDYKNGTNNNKVTKISQQHIATFYGLAKAAGHDEKDSTEPLGTYTPEAKGAIQCMLGVSDLIATAENDLVASKAYKVGEVFTANGKLYKAIAAIAANDSIVLQNEDETVSGANAVETKVGEGFVKFTDYAQHNTPGIVGINSDYGIAINNQQPGHYLYLSPASPEQIKAGTQAYKPITTDRQEKATFYGLAKAAGADEKDSTLPVGQYTDAAKSAIRTMIGAASPNVIAVQDTQPTDTDTKIWLRETAETPVEVPTIAEMNAALATKMSAVFEGDGLVIISGESVWSGGEY